MKLYPSNFPFCLEDGSALERKDDEGTDPLVGEVLNERYKVLELLHRGRHSRIYRALHTIMERQVVIKAVAPHLASDATNLRRFQHEAQAASSLEHPGVITVYDFGSLPSGPPYLVMDPLDGPNLQGIIDGAPLSTIRFRKLFFILCKAMSHAHKSGVIHNDLKPSHFVTRKYEPNEKWLKINEPLPLNAGDEIPVIVDFRLASFTPSFSKKHEDLGQVGEVVGTPLYMSPEHCMAHATDERSDIYSMGCSMYFALTGAPPFEGHSMIDTMQMHMCQKPDTSRLPQEVGDIVLKAMEKNPQNRFQTMESLADAIVQI